MSSSSVQLPSFIYLYNGARTENLNLEEIEGYLESWFKQVKIELREDFFSHYFSHLSPGKKDTTVDEIARKLASLKVRQVNRNKSFAEPLGVEVEYERRTKTAASTMPTGRKTSFRLNLPAKVISVCRMKKY